MPPVSYLGDGVYATIETDMICLTTGSHIKEHSDNIVWLEPEVFVALVKFATQNEFASLKINVDN